jgi:hypothetical protein
MTYTVELITNVDELYTAYQRIAAEEMRCAPPDVNLHPDRSITRVAVEHGYAYVARDETGTICGAALIWPDGHGKWVTLPTSDALDVLAALLDHFKVTTGVVPWGQVETPALYDTISAHPDVTPGGGTVLYWKKD